MGYLRLKIKMPFEMSKVWQNEGLLVGSSSGAALQGALNLKAQLSEGTIVVVFQMVVIDICLRKYLI